MWRPVISITLTLPTLEKAVQGGSGDGNEGGERGICLNRCVAYRDWSRVRGVMLRLTEMSGGQMCESDGGSNQAGAGDDFCYVVCRSCQTFERDSLRNGQAEQVGPVSLAARRWLKVPCRRCRRDVHVRILRAGKDLRAGTNRVAGVN